MASSNYRDMTVAIVSTDVEELVMLAKAGAPQAGPYLVSLCGARLARYVGLIASDLSEADRDEVCERAVERAVLRINAYDPALGSFDGWLRGFARVVAHEQL